MCHAMRKPIYKYGSTGRVKEIKQYRLTDRIAPGISPVLFVFGYSEESLYSGIFRRLIVVYMDALEHR